MSLGVRIRAARAGELPLLQEIERAAGERFRDVGMPEIADDEPFPVDVLERYRRDGGAWVATDDADRPVAYLLAEPVDGALHVEQVSVHPDHARRGIGRALLSEAVAWAPTAGIHRLELHVYARNRAAIALYEAFEFAREGVRRDYIREGQIFLDDVMMARLF